MHLSVKKDENQTKMIFLSRSISTCIVLLWYLCSVVGLIKQQKNETQYT